MIENPELAGKALKNPFFLAPVAGYSDAAYRAVCFSMGAALCYTEMVSAEALVRGHPKTKLLLERSDEENEYVIQLFGSKPETLAAAARIVSAWKPLAIDLNCGCPVPKIVKTGAGSSLLKTPQKITAIVRAMRGSTGIPITVKIRKGWDESSVNFLETGAAAVDAGAAAVTLHGRTRSQGYGGSADWESIALLAKSIAVPVFGSGDVFSAQSAISMLKQTGCGGVMIARGAMGNPFIFAEAEALWAGRAAPPVTNADVARLARRHLDLAIGFFGERVACVEFRKQFCSYSRGRPGGASLREKAVRCSTRVEFESVFKEFESGEFNP